MSYLMNEWTTKSMGIWMDGRMKDWKNDEIEGAHWYDNYIYRRYKYQCDIIITTYWASGKFMRKQVILITTN